MENRRLRLGTHKTGLWPDPITHSSLSFNTQLRCRLLGKRSPTSPGEVKYFLFWSPSLTPSIVPLIKAFGTALVLWWPDWLFCLSNHQPLGFLSFLLLRFPAQSLAYNNYMEYVLAQNKFLKSAKSEVGNKCHQDNVSMLFTISLLLAVSIVMIILV